MTIPTMKASDEQTPSARNLGKNHPKRLRRQRADSGRNSGADQVTSGLFRFSVPNSWSR